MAAKKTQKVELLVVTDAIQLADGSQYNNGQRFSIGEADAKELLKTGGVIKAG